MHGILLLIHVLSATVWTGGHLVLALAVLPRAMRNRSPAELLQFENGYERIGMPALLIQVVTGLWMAHDMLPNVSDWFSFGNGLFLLIAAKLTLLGLTAAIALHARLRLIPRLSPANLVCLARHIAAVTLFSVLFVVVGVSFRTGWV